MKINYLQSRLEIFLGLTLPISKYKQHQIHEEKRHVTKVLLQAGLDVVNFSSKSLFSFSYRLTQRY